MVAVAGVGTTVAAGTQVEQPPQVEVAAWRWRPPLKRRLSISRIGRDRSCRADAKLHFAQESQLEHDDVQAAGVEHATGAHFAVGQGV